MRRVDLGPARTFLVTGAAVGLVWGGCVALGWTSGLHLPIRPQDPGHQPWSQVWPIMSTNLAVALGLMSGVVTLGVSSVAGSMVVALYTGAVVSAAVSAWGAAGAVSGLLPFFGFELAGLLVASIAGLLPVVHGIRATRTTQPPRDRLLSRVGPAYAGGLRWSLWCCAAAAVLIVLGAVTEVAGGLPR